MEQFNSSLASFGAKIGWVTEYTGMFLYDFRYSLILFVLLTLAPLSTFNIVIFHVKGSC